MLLATLYFPPPTPQADDMLPRCGPWGRRLAGDYLTHFIYLDEAGINAGDPVTVVAGIAVDADRMLIDIDQHMRALLEEHMPKPWPSPLHISAKALFHGTKPFDDETIWTKDKRLAYLHDILLIPRLGHIPVVMGFCRNFPEDDEGKTPKQAKADRHGRAFTVCSIVAEQFMRTETRPRNVATMILENQTETRDALKRWHQVMRTPSVLERLDPEFHRWLPLMKIVEDPLFAEKDASPCLPIADAITFTFCRYLSGRSHSESLMEYLLNVGWQDRLPNFLGQRSANQYYRFDSGIPPGTMAPGFRFGAD